MNEASFWYEVLKGVVWFFDWEKHLPKPKSYVFNGKRYRLDRNTMFARDGQHGHPVVEEPVELVVTVRAVISSGGVAYACTCPMQVLTTAGCQCGGV